MTLQKTLFFVPAAVDWFVLVGSAEGDVKGEAFHA